MEPAGSSSHQIGTKLAHYENTSHLGSGGGDVYRPPTTKPGRSVAIKLLSGGVHVRPERLSRFRGKQALASMNHANRAWHLVHVPGCPTPEGLYISYIPSSCARA